MRTSLYRVALVLCCCLGVVQASDEYDAFINEASIRYGVSAALIKSVMRAESAFNPNAQSTLSNGDSGAQGLMQLMPATAAEMGVTNSFDPRDNIMGGTRYLAQMLAAHGNNPVLALAAYNAGPGNVQQYGGVPPFEETVNYIQRISGFLPQYGGASLNTAGLPGTFITNPSGGVGAMASLQNLPSTADVLTGFQSAVGIAPNVMANGIALTLGVILFIWISWHVMAVFDAFSKSVLPLQSAFFLGVRALLLLTVLIFFISGTGGTT